MLPELPCSVKLGGHGFYVLGLELADGGEHVTCRLLDERHETSVAEGAVGSAEEEVVGEGGDADAEVGRYAVRGTP